MNEAQDRELLASAVLARSPHAAEYQAEECIIRYGRWGTCSDCPRADGAVYPERCECTERYDHRIDSTEDGVFHFDGKTMTRDEFLAFIVARAFTQARAR